MNWAIYIDGFLVICLLAFATWLLSLYLKDVSIVDSAWSLMFLAATLTYVTISGIFDTKNIIILILVSLWAIRLFAHLTWRNWGEPEDRRYRVIREKYSPHFQFKSLVIIFLFQAILAWIITLPLLGIAVSTAEPGHVSNVMMIAGVLIWAIGFLYESVADWQLAKFKLNSENSGKVMNKGLWRHTRHPNYFGETLIWWGIYCIAVSAGAWWAIPGPLLITWLLLKFSGVVMLEETITKRRPAYREYVSSTNAFIPGPVKKAKATLSDHQAEGV